MRGVISLAAAIAVPQVLASGEPFVQRNMIIFLTFSVILVTLVVQGLALPPVIRALGIGSAPTQHDGADEEREARRAMVEAALAHLEQIRNETLAEDEVYADIAQHYRRRLALLDGTSEHAVAGTKANPPKSFAQLSRELLKVERQAAVQLRNQRRIGDEVLRELEYELDLSELKFSGSKVRP